MAANPVPATPASCAAKVRNMSSRTATCCCSASTSKRKNRALPGLPLAFAIQSPGHDRSDDERDDADRFTQRMRADDDRKMLEQTVEANERREREQHGSDQRERLV